MLWLCSKAGLRPHVDSQPAQQKQNPGPMRVKYMQDVQHFQQGYSGLTARQVKWHGQWRVVRTDEDGNVVQLSHPFGTN